MNTQSIHEGGCACGAVRFRVSAEPIEVNMCHCMTCRKVQGAVFGVYAIFLLDTVSISGETRVWKSSALGRRHFCGLCGSPVFLKFDGSDEIEIPTGVFDETGLYAPEFELWTRRREPWLAGQGIPQYRESYPDGD